MRFTTSLAGLGLMATAALARPACYNPHRHNATAPHHTSAPAQNASAAPTSMTAPAAVAPTMTSVASQASATVAPQASQPADNTTSVSGQKAASGATSGSSGPQNVVYWGQNGGGTVENNDLSHYCSQDAGVDIIVLAFLYQYGNGVLIPSGTFGQSCSVDTSGKPSNCDDLAKAISTCKSNGVKVIMSLGGATGAYSLTSQQEAETIGQNLWDAYGGGKGSVPRPFGDVAVDGWDFDIESNSGNNYYQYMIAKLRSNFNGGQYYITGAPQCPIPEPNMNEIITSSQFDYLWVQFYNNPGCSTSGTINWDEWKKNIANTPSANAKIFIGVPAAPNGATGTASGAAYYLEPSALNTLVSAHKSDAAFGGVMMWAAGFSDTNVNNGCTYAQEAKKILTTGQTC